MTRVANDEVSLFGQVVVVTGASSGVGRAVALAFGARGARVALLARNVGPLTIAAEEIRRAGGDPLVVPTEVADPDAVERAAAAVEAHWGRIDTWVNVAVVAVLASCATGHRPRLQCRDGCDERGVGG